MCICWMMSKKLDSGESENIGQIWCPQIEEIRHIFWEYV